MKKNTLILLLVLVALLAGTYYFVSRPASKSTLDSAETDFAVADTAAVTRIFMSSRSGNNNLLERKGPGQWILNKKYPANPTMVNLILETLNRMQVRRPVAKQARNTVIKTLAAQGSKVEIYTKDGLLKTFYVGGNTLDEKGSHFLMEGAEDPYVLHIRGFDGYLSSRFSFPENDIRSREIFTSIPPAIQELKVVYPDTPSYNFTISQQNGRFVVDNAPNADSLKVRKFVSSFHDLHAERIISNAGQRYLDSLSLIKPWMVITLKDANPKKNNKLVVYPSHGDPDRWVARYGEGSEELATIQKFTYAKVLLNREDLLNEQKTAKQP